MLLLLPLAHDIEDVLRDGRAGEAGRLPCRILPALPARLSLVLGVSLQWYSAELQQRGVTKNIMFKLILLMIV